ncbi:MAG: hypothetical protein NT027_09765 [Proteobacteria bacterium]|nr:hypothetical protein [Pseudomonadota bacterium]
MQIVPSNFILVLTSELFFNMRIAYNKLRRLNFWAFLVAHLIFIGGCASYSEKTVEMRSAYDRGEWDGALKALKESGSMESRTDRLLWRLEAATIYDRMGETSKTKKLFLEADSIADELFTTSIANTATSFVISDSSTDYEGEDYEKVAIHTMLAHHYIGQGKLDEARISARKIGTKLTEINQKYDDSHKNKYSDDAHGRYLSGIVYEAKQEWDNAIVEYWKAISLYEGEFKQFVQGSMVPRSLVKATYALLAFRKRDDRVKILKDKYSEILKESPEDAAKSVLSKGEIITLHEIGRVTPKTKFEYLIPFGRQVVRFSFPKLDVKYFSPGQTGMQIEGKSFVESENTAYMDKIAQETLDNRRTRMVAKSMTRLLVKGQIADQAHQKFGPLGGLLANAATAATETADTRSWTLLPKGLYVSRVQLSPGEYKIAVKTNGKISQMKTIKVEAGKIDLLRGWD